jgi:Flp pilus assembly protein TadG
MITGRRREMMLKGRSEKGQAAVEVALVIPIFLLVAIAVASFAPAFEKHLQLNNAVRAAARVMSTCRFADAGVATTKANTAYSANAPSSASSTPTINVGSASPWEVCNDGNTGTNTASGGDQVTVTASLPVKITILGITYVNTTINSSSVSTVE